MHVPNYFQMEWYYICKPWGLQTKGLWMWAPAGFHHQTVFSPQDGGHGWPQWWCGWRDSATTSPPRPPPVPCLCADIPWLPGGDAGHSGSTLDCTLHQRALCWSTMDLRLLRICELYHCYPLLQCHISSGAQPFGEPGGCWREGSLVELSSCCGSQCR